MNEKLIRAIEGYRHEYYERTCNIAQFAKQVVTGEAYGELVVNYAPRETDEQKIQRVEISQVRTKAIAGKVEGFFKRAFRVDKLKIDVSHENEEEAQRIGQYMEAYGDDGQSLLNWSEETALFYNNIDPNSFYWVKHTVENEQDYFEPVIFEAVDSLDYEIKKGKVDCFVGRMYQMVTYSDGKAQKTAEIPYYYYFSNEVIQLAIMVDAEVKKNTNFYDQFYDEEGFLTGALTTIQDCDYIFTEMPNEIGVCPVSRVGYSHDKITNKNTYVTFWDDATEDYRILIQDGSAFDIALRLHTFPKLIMMYTPCNYADTSTNAICRDGYMHPHGGECPSCKGTGKKYHTTGQDIIEIQLPTADQPHVIKPSDIIHYADAPFEIVNKLNELVDSAGAKISEAIFSIDISHQHTGNATATEVTNYKETAQDVLYEFTKSPRKLFLFTVDIMSKYLEIDDLQADFMYNNQFDLETVGELLGTLKMAKEAGAPPEVIEHINGRLVAKQNRTDSTYMNVYNAMRKFQPFANIPQDAKNMFLSTLPDSSIQKALYYNFKAVSEEIIANYEEWLLLDYDAQKARVEEIAKKYADKYVQDNSVNRVSDFAPDDFMMDEEE